VWDTVRPLVFINACQSADILPETLLSYVDAFVGGGGAAGMIGTEVMVHQELAQEFAELFFERFVTPGSTTGDALHAARIDFLRSGNLFGLVYTSFCWADLDLVESV
jgi:hypothetical protein